MTYVRFLSYCKSLNTNRYTYDTLVFKMADEKTKYGTARISEDLLAEVTKIVKEKPLWINEIDFIREAIRDKIKKVTECKQEA